MLIFMDVLTFFSWMSVHSMLRQNPVAPGWDLILAAYSVFSNLIRVKVTFCMALSFAKEPMLAPWP